MDRLLIPAVLGEAFIEGLRDVPRPGEWYPVFQLLTAVAAQPPAVCLLSQVELRATPSTISIATRSTRAAANLATNRSATLVAWADGVAYLELDLRLRLEREGMSGYLFDVRDIRRDDIGIDLRPFEYRMEAWLVAAERWETSRAVLDALDAASM